MFSRQESLSSHMCFLFQVPSQAERRFSEPDNREWRGRPAQLPASADERSWENIRENRDFNSRFDSREQDGNQFSQQDQLSSQFSSAQISSNQMVIEIWRRP